MSNTKEQRLFLYLLSQVGHLLNEQSHQSSSFVTELRASIWEHQLFSIPFSEIQAMEGRKMYM